MKNIYLKMTKTVFIVLTTTLAMNVTGCAMDGRTVTCVSTLPESLIPGETSVDANAVVAESETIAASVIPETTGELESEMTEIQTRVPENTLSMTSESKREMASAAPDFYEPKESEVVSSTDIDEEIYTVPVETEAVEKTTVPADETSEKTESETQEVSMVSSETENESMPMNNSAEDTEPSLILNPAYYSLDLDELRSVGKEATRQAIEDACGHHVVTACTFDGEEVTYTFQFNDELIQNQQRRADWANDHGVVTHQEIDGTFLADSESCGSMLAYFEWWGENKWVYQGWEKHSEERQELYDDFYTCVYNSAYMLVTEHGRNLSEEDKYIYFGYGFSMIPVEDPLFGMEQPIYAMEIYVGAMTYSTTRLDFAS